MLVTKRYSLAIIASIIALVIGVHAQQPNPTSPVRTVEVTASAKEAEVGQQVKLTAVAKGASGSVLNVQPSTYFAGPLHLIPAFQWLRSACHWLPSTAPAALIES